MAHDRGSQPRDSGLRGSEGWEETQPIAGASWAALAFASCRPNSAVAFPSFATSAGCGWILLDAAQPIARAWQSCARIQKALGANTALLD